MNKEEFINEVKKLNLDITSEMLNKLEIYANYLIKYNEHTNLTRITDINEIYLKHFYDSLTILKAIDLNSINTLIDVGTGAGFPGMVLAICFPNLKVTLLDSNNKKIIFLNCLKEKININNVKIIKERSEEYALNHLDDYDVVTARAVSNMSILSEICLPLVKVGGYFIPLKGLVNEELDDAKNIINKLNGKIDNVINFDLPDNESNRTIIKIVKVNKTPNGYPRKYNNILKSLKKGTK